MPEVTDDQIKGFLERNAADIAQSLSAAPPLAQDPLFAKMQREQELHRQYQEREKHYKERLLSENRQGDVPFDIETGAPTWQRIKGSFRREPEQVIKFWQDLYGSGNVRPAMFQGKPTGGLIIRMPDEKTQKPKDILVDEENLSLKDLSDISGAVPEIAGAIVAGLGAKKLMALKEAPAIARGARDILATTVGAETVGALKDIAVREPGKMLPEAGEVFEERLGEIPKDLLFGAVLGLAGKTLGKIITPFGDRPPPINVEGMQAGRYMQERFGEVVPFSPGQRTGVPMLQRVEAEMPRLPGGSQLYSDLRAEQQNIFQRIMDRIQGLTPDSGPVERAAVPTAERVGRELETMLQTANEPLDLSVTAARNKLLNRYQRDIEETISNATTPQRQLYADKIGAHIRSRVKNERSNFQEQSALNYEAAKSLPGGRDRILIAESLPKRAQEYLDKQLPTKEVISEVPTGVVGPGGEMITRTETGKELLKEFIPSGVVGKLRELASVGRTKFSLQDLINMRNEVDNDILIGEAIPGVRTHHLNRIRGMLTDAIKESTDAIPDKQLRNAWQKANDWHAANVGKFQTPLISAILKPAEAAGFVGDTALVNRIVSGADKITEVKQFLGEGSREYTMLKRGIADKMFEGNLIPGTTKLDANAFLKELTDLRANNRRTFDEVFGQYGNELIEQSKIMGLGKLSGAKLDAEIIARDIAQPGQVPRIQQLVRAEKAKETAYGNQIRKWVGSRSIPANEVRPAELVDWIVSKGQISEVKEVMSLLQSNSALRDRVRSKAVESLLAQAARTPTQADRVALRLDPNRIVNSDRLIQLLGDSEKQQVYESVLGATTMKDLEMLAKALKPIEQQQKTYAAAGGISGGMAVSGFLRGELSQFGTKAIKHKIISALLTMKPSREWLGNQVLSRDAQRNMVGAFIMSEPFIESLVDEYGVKGAQDMARKLSYEITTMPGTPPPQRTPTQEDINRFIQTVR